MLVPMLVRSSPEQCMPYGIVRWQHEAERRSFRASLWDPLPSFIIAGQAQRSEVCFFSPVVTVMSLEESFPAYGGRGPSDMKLGIALGVITTVIMVLRVYVRVRINEFGTSALLWTLVSWVCWPSSYQFIMLTISSTRHSQS